jgi:hypothetical protein
MDCLVSSMLFTAMKIPRWCSTCMAIPRSVSSSLMVLFQCHLNRPENTTWPGTLLFALCPCSEKPLRIRQLFSRDTRLQDASSFRHCRATCSLVAVGNRITAQMLRIQGTAQNYSRTQSVSGTLLKNTSVSWGSVVMFWTRVVSPHAPSRPTR